MVRTMRQAFRSIQSDSPQAILDGYAFLLRRILLGEAAALDALGSMLTYGVGVKKNAASCSRVLRRCIPGVRLVQSTTSHRHSSKVTGFRKMCQKACGYCARRDERAKPPRRTTSVSAIATVRA